MNIEQRTLVIGGVTIDTIHLPDYPNTVQSPGGAGLFTALGVQLAGGVSTLFAQRPSPLPEILKPVADALQWVGPGIQLEDLPRLEIAHYGAGKAELLGAHWGAQLNLDTSDLKEDLKLFNVVHVAALGPTQKQIDFVNACRQRGAGVISGGTYGRAAYGETEPVLELIRSCDYFFMNENEACGLYGSVSNVRVDPGKIVFVTRGNIGAVAITEEDRIFMAAPAVREADPTGAGDTFCGAVLAVLSSGGSIRDALSTGVRLASESITQVGPKI